MSGIKVDVTPPTERQDGTPVTLAEIASWRIEIQADGAPDWTPVGGENPPTDLSKTIGNVADGTWNVRTIWKDTDDQDGAPNEGQVSIATTPPPPPARLAAGGMTLTVV